MSRLWGSPDSTDGFCPGSICLMNGGCPHAPFNSESVAGKVAGADRHILPVLVNVHLLGVLHPRKPRQGPDKPSLTWSFQVFVPLGSTWFVPHHIMFFALEAVALSEFFFLCVVPFSAWFQGKPKGKHHFD